MKRKVLFLLLFPFIANTVVSCCNCEETTILHYTNKSFSVQNLDNSGSGVTVSAAGAIPKKAYGIRLLLVRERTAGIRLRNPFSTTAYAMDCFCPPPRQYEPRDSLTAITIFTVNAFDGSHPADADVSEYFKVYQPYSFSSIPDYLKNWRKVLYDEGELPAFVDLLLMKPPEMNSRHAFKVQLTLSDGRILLMETVPVDLI